jgi:hypothetical protein
MIRHELKFIVTVIVWQDPEGIKKQQLKRDLKEVKNYCVNQLQSIERLRGEDGLNLINIKVSPVKNKKHGKIREAKQK